MLLLDTSTDGCWSRHKFDADASGHLDCVLPTKASSERLNVSDLFLRFEHKHWGMLREYPGSIDVGSHLEHIFSTLKPISMIVLRSVSRRLPLLTVKPLLRDSSSKELVYLLSHGLSSAISYRDRDSMGQDE